MSLLAKKKGKNEVIKIEKHICIIVTQVFICDFYSLL